MTPAPRYRIAFYSLTLLFFHAQHSSADTNITVSLEDRLQIQELFAHYAHSWDSKDVARYVDLFTEDAVFQTLLAGNLAAEFTSHEQLTAYGESLTSSYRTAGIQTRHYITNSILTAQTDGSIKAETYFQVLQQQAGERAPVAAHTGIYTDIFVHTLQGWKFTRHEVRLDHE